MTRIRIAAWTFGLATLLALPTASSAQDPAALQRQQMMMSMQEHARQLSEAMRRMESVQERARQMEQQMLREMEQLRLQQAQESQSAQAAQIAERLRQQERLREMAHSVSLGAQEMHRAMEQLRNMLEGPGGPLGGEMEQEVARLRNHWELMVGSMEEGLRLLERLRDRVQASAPTGG
jgi:uncharacterized protein Yka (UPF0111/DUF47 family)